MVAVAEAVGRVGVVVGRSFGDSVVVSSHGISSDKMRKFETGDFFY